MPAKHQPDLIYLRYVPLWKVHIFTLVQLTCLVLLWVIKASAAAVVFPMMVMSDFYHLTATIRDTSKHIVTDYLYVFYFSFVYKSNQNEILIINMFVPDVPLCIQVLALVFIRKLLDFFFTKRELSWLDDLMPESKKKKEDDKKKKAREKLVNVEVFLCL